MGIAEYSQEEAEWLISLAKTARYEAEIYEVANHYRPGFSSKAFDCDSSAPQSAPVKFRIKTEANTAIGAYCIVLQGAIGDRRMEGICRYDVHETIHANDCSCCAPPPEIMPGQFHVHRYSECTIRRGNNWDKCSTILPIDDIAFKRQVRQLIGAFIEDMRLSFSDSGRHVLADRRKKSLNLRVRHDTGTDARMLIVGSAFKDAMHDNLAHSAGAGDCPLTTALVHVLGQAPIKVSSDSISPVILLSDPVCMQWRTRWSMCQADF